MLHKFQFLKTMAATSQADVICVLCAFKLDDKPSRVNLRRRCRIQEAAVKACKGRQHAYVFSLPSQVKLKKITDQLVRNFGNDSGPNEFIPSINPSIPTKAVEHSFRGAS